MLQTNSLQKQTSSALCMNACTEVALFRESFGVSDNNHILRVHGHTILQEKEAANIFGVGKGRSKDSLQFLLRTMRNKPRSAPANQKLGTTEHRMLPAQTTLIAAKPRMLDMIRDAATAGILPDQPLLTRRSALIESGIVAFLDALDDADRPTAMMYLQRGSPGSGRVVAADNPRTQRPNHHEPKQCQKLSRVARPRRTMTTTPNPHLPNAEEAVSEHHSSRPNCPSCLTEPTCDA